MKVTPLEFRLRLFVYLIVYFLGFTAPWERFLHLDRNRTLWLWLASRLGSTHWLSFTAATVVVLIAGILCAVVAAFLRTWAAAYMDVSVVHDQAMHGEQVVSAGPYRYLRNPLYLGTFIHTFALALLMPPSGAIFCIVAVFLFQLRLIAGEESFLAAKLGEPYLAYRAKVPSLVPALTPRVPASTTRPAWPTAFLGEIYMWGVVVTFAVFGWRYNSILLIKGVLISLGVSLIVRAFIPKR
jgi:protein-S-isoprenylcysteine O-methyltransferase Ste14